MKNLEQFIFSMTNKNSIIGTGKFEPIAGCGFLGAWVGLVLGATGLIEKNISGEVSLVLAFVGLVFGYMRFVKK